MDSDAIEFVNPEHIIIKSEVFKDDVNFEDGDFIPESNLANNVKCGEIFTANSLDFILVCGYCGVSYSDLHEFGGHIRYNHQGFDDALCKDQLKTESETTPNATEEPDFPKDDEDDKEDAVLAAQPEKRRKQKFFCSGCNKSYSYRQSFQRHKCPKDTARKNEKGDVPLKYEESMGASVRRTRNSNAGNASDVKIRECEEEYLDEDSTIEAVLDNQNEDQMYEGNVKNPDLFCDICLRQFKYKCAFRRHGMQHEISPKALQNDPTYRKCIYCGLTFTDNAAWFLHETKHPKKGLLLCLQCPKRFKTLIELESHNKSHSGQGPAKCDQCNLSFSQSKNLVSHINRVHLRLKPFPCELCDKKFVRKVELSVHMRRHTGERPYQCEECGRSFMISTLLNEHLKRHSNVRDVKCPVCPMAFFTKKMLRKHMVKHSTERPYVCPTCGNNFSRKKALLAHKKIHMDVKQYVCNLCGKAFAQHAGLYMHKKTHMNAVDS